MVAGGSGQRFGAAKQWAELCGRPVAAWAVDACRRVSDGVVLVVDGDPEAAQGRLDEAVRVDHVVRGGATRSGSVRAGLAVVPGDAQVILVHDAARPCASPAVFDRVLAAVVAGADGAVPVVPVTDTLKQIGMEPGARQVGQVRATVGREGLASAQTPQAFSASTLRAAYSGDTEATDDAGLVELHGATVVSVEGDAANFKITTPEDLERARHSLAPSAGGAAGSGAEVRIGHGYDVHAWAVESRSLVLGGVTVDSARGLAGHSDADAVCHALIDAILGAVGEADIGTHFPDNDPQWAGVDSTGLLAAAVEIAGREGWKVSNADVTVVAESPRIAPHVAAMKARLSEVVGAPVSVKATTAEGLGSLGRGEGISATAVVLVSRVSPR